MSDQPDVERTFWFKCSRGHVEELPMPSESDLTLCGALIPDESPDGGRVVCAAELRHLGPTVQDWRAAMHGDEVERLTRMLAEADAALAECSRQIDGLALNPRTKAAEDETRRLRGELDARQEQLLALDDELRNATQGVMLNRDAAAREASAVHERDVARREAAVESALLRGLRERMLAEAERLDDRGRHRSANRIREAVTDSWPGGHAPGLCLPVETHYQTFEEFGTGAEPGTFLREALAAAAEAIEAEAKRSGSLGRWECTGFGGAEPQPGAPEPEPVKWRVPETPPEGSIATLSGPPLKLDTFLGHPTGDWQNALSELRTVTPPPSTGPAMILAAVAELRDARSYRIRTERQVEELEAVLARGRADYETLRQRMLRAEAKVHSRGFTLVRDVNQQTEAELERVRGDYRDQRNQRQRWQDVAVWAATSNALDVRGSRSDVLTAIVAAYERAIDGEADL